MNTQKFTSNFTSQNHSKTLENPQPNKIQQIQMEHKHNHTSPYNNSSLSQHTKQQNQYKAYKIPADWKMAEQHGKSIRPGKIITSRIEEMQEKLGKNCPCCNQYIHKDDIGYCQDIRQLAYLGDGFPLYYNFLHHCRIMLVALILTQGAVQLYQNMTQNHLCSQVKSKQICANSQINDMATISSDPTPTLDIIIQSLSFIAQLGILIYFRHQQSLSADNLNERNTTPSDYTFFLQNIPRSKQQSNKTNIERFIKSINPDYTIKQILLINQLSQFYSMEQQLRKLVKQKQEILIKNFNQDLIDQIDDQMQEVQEEIATLARKKMNEEDQFNGMAFIVFQHSPEMIECRQIIQKLPTWQLQDRILYWFPDCQLPQAKLHIQIANQPGQYDWENIHYPSKIRHLYRILCTFLYTIILAIVTLLFYFGISKKSQLIEHASQKSQQYYTGVALGYAIVVLINIFNKYVLSWIAHIITDHEKHVHFTNFQYSFAMKYMLGMFFTTAVMTLMVQAIKFHNYTETQGVIQQQTFMFIFNAIFSPLMWLINPSYIIYWIKLKIYKDSSSFTQIEANKLMQYPNYDMGKRYAQIMKTMWFTFLYVSLIPIGTFFSLFGIIIYGLVDKFVLLYRSSVTTNISNNLSLAMLKVLQLTLVLKSAGQLLFAAQLRNQFYVLALIRLLIGILYIILPMNDIIQCVWNQKLAPEYKSYDQTSFALTYRKAYPLTKYCQRKQSFIKQKEQKI